ncbi:Eukaryotic translation initiation factor 3 subunit L [Blyttiomyces sp. JEL0837]|nr:Eukaryotic translation initiation factor 3 subunit L [Blyttiomyces sp. JEL0837]
MYQEIDEDEVVAEEVELPTVFAPDAFIDGMEEELGEFDPTQNQQNYLPQAAIPELVINFLRHFQQSIADRAVWELHGIYENSFNKLTEKFFAKTPWPSAEAVAAILGDDDQIFLILYKELYYRHIYSKLQPSMDDRFNSYANYCDLFNFILISSKTDSEIETLKDRPEVWNVLNVLNVLYSLILKSRINEQLWVSRNGGDMMEAAGEFGSRPLYRMLGYFSIVGLLRVHCLLGDYTMALKTMENIELTKKGLFARVTACHVTTYYYVGFAYMMMRRYSDAIKAFAHILLFVSRTKQYHTRSYQYEVISKKSEQMYALLVMCVALSPQRIDENVHTLMREKYGDHLLKMQKEGEESLAVFEELFLFACPKFISPAQPRYEVAANLAHAPTQHQLRIFLNEFRQQVLVGTIRSYLKLYTTLRIDKLATFLDKSPEKLRTELLVYKHKTRQRRWESGSVSEGEYASASDIDFYVKQDMIHIAESKVGRRVGDWFIRHIAKFDETITSLERGN